MDPLVVFVTASSHDEAWRLAEALVAERLAACVNVVPGMRSVYRWQGRVERADEALLVVKTARHLLGEVIARVHALHSYTVPEVLAVAVAGGAPAYLAWLGEQLRPAAAPPAPAGL